MQTEAEKTKAKQDSKDENNAKTKSDEQLKKFLATEVSRDATKSLSSFQPFAK